MLLSRRSQFRAFLVACLMLAACGSRPAPANPTLVSDWMEVAARERVAWLDRTPQNARADAIVALAMFEAANAVEQRYPSYLHLPPVSADTPVDVAVSSAAAASLARLYPEKADIFAAELRVRTAGANDASHRRAMALGERAAEAAAARGGQMAGEPAAPRWNRNPSPPGVYVPESDASAIAAFDLALAPWGLDAAHEARPAAPPPLSSQSYVDALDEVRSLGGRESAVRTPEQAETASFWFFIDMNPVLRQIASQPGRSAAQNARMYSMFYMATDDAWIASADAKLRYQFWRPVAAIRRAGEDGAAASVADPSWSPLLPTPPHPEYPCAHCLQAAAQAVVLAQELDDPDALFELHSSTVPEAAPRRVTLQGYVDQTVESRIYAGAHFRFAATAGLASGETVGRRVLERWSASARADAAPVAASVPPE